MKNFKKLFMLLLLLIVPFMLVGCGDDDDDDERESKKDKTKTEEKVKDNGIINKKEKEEDEESTGIIGIQTITCTGNLSGVDVVVTYSRNNKTNEELINTMQYTISYSSSAVNANSEKSICSGYESSGFKNCHVKFENEKAIITVTPENNVYSGLSFDAIKTELEGTGLTCNIK